MSELNDIWNDNSKGKLPADKLMAYLEGRLSAEEQREVELWLSEEGMESDASEGLMNMPSGDTKKIAQQLNRQLQQKLGERRGRKKRVRFGQQWPIIAMLIIILLSILAFGVFYLLSK